MSPPATKGTTYMSTDFKSPDALVGHSRSRTFERGDHSARRYVRRSQMALWRKTI